MTFDVAAAEIMRRGWVAIDLPDPAPVFAVRDRLLEWLRRQYPGLNSLSEYHALGLSDDRHLEVLFELSRFYWDADLARTIIAANLGPLRNLMGPDLHIQRYPYIRVVRAGHASDATPIHRDIYYGASPYEVAVVIPLTPMDDAAALRVISGSHLAPDSEYPYLQTTRDDIAIGSPQHQMGFPYAPRVLDPALEARAQAVPLRVGQALIFPLSLVHGSLNEGGACATRFSTDIRLANTWAPVSWNRGVHPDYFVPLCASPVTDAARRYLDANQRHSTLGKLK